jgi:hypothetical protein
MRKWAIWIPVLLVASLLYWTVALGLGGLSLMVVSSFDCDGDRPEAGELEVEGLKDSYEPITVNLVESSEAADVEGGTGAGAAAGHRASDPGPGATAF